MTHYFLPVNWNEISDYRAVDQLFNVGLQRFLEGVGQRIFDEIGEERQTVGNPVASTAGDPSDPQLDVPFSIEIH